MFIDSTSVLLASPVLKGLKLPRGSLQHQEHFNHEVVDEVVDLITGQGFSLYRSIVSFPGARSLASQTRS